MVPRFRSLFLLLISTHRKIVALKNLKRAGLLFYLHMHFKELILVKNS